MAACLLTRQRRLRRLVHTLCDARLGRDRQHLPGRQRRRQWRTRLIAARLPAPLCLALNLFLTGSCVLWGAFTNLVIT
jgi:hypothetical protein